MNQSEPPRKKTKLNHPIEFEIDLNFKLYR